MSSPAVKKLLEQFKAKHYAKDGEHIGIFSNEKWLWYQLIEGVGYSLIGQSDELPKGAIIHGQSQVGSKLSPHLARYTRKYIESLRSEGRVIVDCSLLDVEKYRRRVYHAAYLAGLKVFTNWRNGRLIVGVRSDIIPS